jgi:hypothetical protein
MLFTIALVLLAAWLLGRSRKLRHALSGAHLQLITGDAPLGRRV